MHRRGRDQRHERPSDTGSRSRFTIPQHQGVGEEFWVKTDTGQLAYRVCGCVIEDAAGRVVATVHEQIARVKDSISVSDAGGQRLATVHMAVTNPFHERWAVTIGSGPELDIVGDVAGHEYAVTDGHTSSATVSKSRSPEPGRYEVEVSADPATILPTVIAIDILVGERRHTS